VWVYNMHIFNGPRCRYSTDQGVDDMEAEFGLMASSVLEFLLRLAQFQIGLQILL